MTTAKIYNKRLPTMALDTNRIIQRFLDAEVGEVITYGELSSLVGYDIQSKRSALTQAQNRLLNHHGMVFSCVRSVGMKRITAEENIKSTDAYLRYSWMELKKMRLLLKLHLDMLRNTVYFS